MKLEISSVHEMHAMKQKFHKQTEIRYNPSNVESHSVLGWHYRDKFPVRLACFNLYIVYTHVSKKKKKECTHL